MAFRSKIFRKVGYVQRKHGTATSLPQHLKSGIQANLWE
jgi:hypothetical protein